MGVVSAPGFVDMHRDFWLAVKGEVQAIEGEAKTSDATTPLEKKMFFGLNDLYHFIDDKS